MNKYGLQAQNHWKAYLPQRYNDLKNPEEFFTSLGEQVQQRIDDLVAAQTPQSSEDYLENLRALNMVKFNVESDVIREMVLIDPEEDVEELETIYEDELEEEQI